MQGTVDLQQDRADGGGKHGEQEGGRHDGRHVVQADRIDQHETDAALRGEHLADQHAEQREREAHTLARDDLGQGGRQPDRAEGLPRGEPERARDLEIDRADRAHGIQREDRHGNDPVDRAERNLRGKSQPEDQQDHRIERDLRQRVERHQDRLGHLAREPAHAEPGAEAQAAERGEQQRIAERGQALADVAVEAPAPEQFPGAGERLGRAGQRLLAGPAREQPPQQHQPREQGEAVAVALPGRRALRHRASPRRRSMRCSTVCSTMFTAVTLTRMNSISAYIFGVSKLL
jgi:hypothetical protein